MPCRYDYGTEAFTLAFSGTHVAEVEQGMDLKAQATIVNKITKESRMHYLRSQEVDFEEVLTDVWDRSLPPVRAWIEVTHYYTNDSKALKSK